MPRFQVTEEIRPTTNGLDGRFLILHDQEETARAEIWPALGFNCTRWCSSFGGRTVEWLYSSPQLLDESQPTRSGIPILFPFPNRIRDGRFTWEGKTYQLPLNDSSGKNAIHGFACRYPWRVVESGADDNSAWVTGEFWASQDAPETLSHWPTDYRIKITYHLGGPGAGTSGDLRITAVVGNPGHVSLPFGLGYHPYFALPAPPDETMIEVPANEFWRLQDSLPTGVRLPVEERTDLRQPRRYSQLQLDDILTGLQGEIPSVVTSNSRARIFTADNRTGLDVATWPQFRELVAFTPPHRQAICLEPYTCITDAINLQQQGVDAGWLVLPPEQRWMTTVRLTSFIK